MTEVMIEKGVPMPKGYISKGVTATLRSMEAGDSFLVPPDMSMHTLRSTVTKREFVGKFSIRKTTDGFRCWRTK